MFQYVWVGLKCVRSDVLLGDLDVKITCAVLRERIEDCNNGIDVENATKEYYFACTFKVIKVQHTLIYADQPKQWQHIFQSR